MERKYKAFISYRHLPLDTRIATKLHRRIEHYAIPKELRKNGEKRLGFVFRDQDELPLSSDLSMNIQEALDNAEYLIVICTPETNKSAWVLREISYFLEHHDRDHILAVLADGTPQQSFPPQLTGADEKEMEEMLAQLTGGGEEKESQTEEPGDTSARKPDDTVFYSPPMPVHGLETGIGSENEEPAGEKTPSAPEGQPKTEKISEATHLVEPLAANIVASTEAKRNHLFRVESLRILATMIGCSFDDLYRREQRYRMRRFAIAGSVLGAVAAAFIIVLLSSNARIQANYEEALRNQSSYLATESGNLLNAGDRLGAIRLAIDALPSEKQKRPLVSKAELALGEAAGAYLSPANASGIIATGALAHDNSVENFIQNDSGSMLVSVTSSDVITLWDTKTMQKRWELMIKKSSSLSDLYLAGFLDDTAFVAWTDEELYCIGTETGEIIWNKKGTDIPSKLKEEDEYGWFLGGQIDFVVLPPDTGQLTVISDEIIFRIDPAEDRVVSEIPFPAVEGAGYSYLSNAVASEDGRLLAFQYSPPYGEENDDQEGIAVADLENGSLCSQYFGIPDDFYFPTEYVFPDEDHLIFITSDLTKGSSSTFLNLTMHVYSENLLNCLDLKTGELIWTSTHRSSITGGNDLLLRMEDAGGDPVIAYAYANHLDLVDPKNGKLLANTEYDSRIVTLDRMNGAFYCITANGSLGRVDPAEPSEWSAMRYFTDSVIAGQSRQGSYWVQSRNDSANLVHYGKAVEDPAWRELVTKWDPPGDRDTFYIEDTFIADNCIALLDGNILVISDGKTDSPMREITLPTEDGYAGTKYYPGHYYDGIYSMFWSDSGNAGIVHVNLEEMTYDIIPFPEGEDRLLSAFAQENDNTYYLVTCTEGADHRDVEVCIAEPDFSVKKRFDVGEIGMEGGVTSLFDDNRTIYICARDEKTVFRADIKKEKVSGCPEALSDLLLRAAESDRGLSEQIQFSEDGSLLVYLKDSGGLEVMSADGGVHYTIPEGNNPFLSARFLPDKKTLLAVDMGGFLNRYNAKDGTLLGRTELYYSYLYERTDIKWQTTDQGFLIVYVDEVANMVRYEDWGVFAYISSCLGYLENEDFCVCNVYAGDGINYNGFVRYSTEELVRYAEELLKGWDLSDSQKMKYGLKT